jgi:hypothetical protein
VTVRNEIEYYSHTAITPVLVAPDEKRVIAVVRPYDWTRKWSKIMKRRGGLAWRPGRSRLLWGVAPIIGEIDEMSRQLCRAQQFQI